MGRSQLINSPAALGAGKQRERRRFDFMGASKWFFSMSGVILLIGALAIGGKGLNFGIDFESGTRDQDRARTGRPTRTACATRSRRAGFADAEIQRLERLGRGQQRLPDLDRDADEAAARRRSSSDLQKKFGVKSFDYDTIGPTFGKTVAKSAIIAIIASLLVISLYIALRFEWKYAVPVLIALMHDLLITAGVYSLLGREVTTSTVAALLTILGYSLYDTIIVFDRVRENVPRMPRAAFSQIVNRSMSEVLTRSLATSFCTALPILALLFFGGETLKDFAFALLVGVISGTYSSIFIASPVLTHWKEREPVYIRRRRRIAEENGGIVPAYAVGDRRRAGRRRAAREAAPARRITEPEDPGAGVSQAEFDEIVRDLHVDAPPAGAPRRPSPSRSPSDRRDLAPEDLVLKDDKRQDAQAQAPAQQAPREAPLAMAMFAWVMMGLAIWHFTIFLPDRFWGGIVGAFVGALFGAVDLRPARQRLQRSRARTRRTSCRRWRPSRAR